MSYVMQTRRDSLDRGFPHVSASLKSQIARSRRFQPQFKFSEIEEANSSVMLLPPESRLYGICLDIGLNWFSAVVRRTISGSDRRNLAELFGEGRLENARNYRFGPLLENTEIVASDLTVVRVLGQGETCLEALYKAKRGEVLSDENKVLSDTALRTISMRSGEDSV